MKGEEDKNTRKCMGVSKDDTDKIAISMEHSKPWDFGILQIPPFWTMTLENLLNQVFCLKNKANLRQLQEVRTKMPGSKVVFEPGR